MGWGRVLYLGGSRSKQMWFEGCIGLVGVCFRAWLTLKEQTSNSGYVEIF